MQEEAATLIAGLVFAETSANPAAGVETPRSAVAVADTALRPRTLVRPQPPDVLQRVHLWPGQSASGWVYIRVGQSATLSSFRFQPPAGITTKNGN